MITSDKKIITTDFPTAYICDCCGKWSIRKIGGYASVLGDGNVVGVDLCENCVEKVLGKYLKNYGNLIHDD